MTVEAKRALRLSFLVFAAAILQAAFAQSLQIAGARPDFLMATAITAAMYCNANIGAVVAFATGVLYASYASPPHGGFGSLIVSRTAVGAGVGWLEERMFRDSPFIAISLTFLGTGIAGCLFFVFDPQSHILSWAYHLLQTMIYNAVLAIPLYVIAHRWIAPLRTGAQS